MGHRGASGHPNYSSGAAEEVNVSYLRFYGTPGPTTLDKGSLSLGRSLDVPRVSRYDVDTETPRPEKLLVDFDTTVNSSPTDISGQGNHGAFYSGASYSAADKAFNFSGWSNDTPVGTEDWIQATATGTSGNFIHSVSMWVKSRIPDTSTTSRSTFHMGNAGVANQEMQIQFNYTNNIVYLGTQNGWLTMSNMEDIIKQNQWHHIAYTYNGTNMLPANTKFYIDGKQMTMGGGSSSTLNFPSSTEDIFIGRFNSPTSANWWNGQISNFKLYSVALEPSEVRKLYNLGRTGRSMVISDTAVGIGRAPEAQLDVRGVIRGPGLTIQTVNSYKSDTTMFSGSAGVTDISGLSVTIQPKFANSKILVSYDVNMGGKGRVYLRVKRVQGASTSYFQSDQGAGGGPQTAYDGAATSTYAGTNTDAEVNGYSFKCLDNAGGLDPITYTIQGWTNHSVYEVCINRAFVDTAGTYWARCVSSITAQEVCQ
tara:strand:+ start:138 stop:1580 length:1443 start_codon:yes stop_codon:yes gene_type:complete